MKKLLTCMSCTFMYILMICDTTNCMGEEIKRKRNSWNACYNSYHILSSFFA